MIRVKDIIVGMSLEIEPPPTDHPGLPTGGLLIARGVAQRLGLPIGPDWEWFGNRRPLCAVVTLDPTTPDQLIAYHWVGHRRPTGWYTGPSREDRLRLDDLC